MQLVLLCVLIGSACAAPAADEVASLPGFDGSLPSKHYSGYLSVRGGENHVHYYLQLSEGDPAKDPITLWSNGGPGCTSLKGAFEELGQLVFDRDSAPASTNASVVPKLYYNPTSWTKLSTMLYFEHPTGVGFSYCDSCLGNATCNCQATDTTAAADNYEAVVAFFKLFPEFAKNDFYITGESYAGIYISMLMGQVMDKGGVDNLKGAAIGNGCTGNKKGACTSDRAPYLADLYWGNGLYSAELRKRLLAGCAPDQWQSDACSKLTDEMNTAVGPHNFYNLQDFCPGTALPMKEWLAASTLRERADGTIGRMDEVMHTHTAAATAATAAGTAAGTAGTAAGPSACVYDDLAAPAQPLGARQRWCNVDSMMMRWLAIPEVQEALHVAKPKGTENNNLDYRREGADDLTDLYKALAKKYRLWIYNGQEDGCVPYNAMEDFTTGLGFPVTTSWHPWLGPDAAGGARVAAGYATQYGGDSKDLAFVTIKGAGHEVPTYKPDAAFHMFAAFLNGTAL